VLAIIMGDIPWLIASRQHRLPQTDFVMDTGTNQPVMNGGVDLHAGERTDHRTCDTEQVLLTGHRR